MTRTIDAVMRLIHDYEAGLYTHGELVAKTIEVLYGSSELREAWDALPSELQGTVVKALSEFRRGSTVVPIGTCLTADEISEMLEGLQDSLSALGLDASQ